MRDRESLLAFLQQMIAALGVAGTLVGVLGDGSQESVGVFLLLVLVLLVVLVFLYHFVPWGIPWRKVRRGILLLIQRLPREFSSPDVVIGFGRAGSVIGAILAANLGRRPFIALDIQHIYVNGARRVIVDGPIKLKPEELRDKKILLVSAYVESSETFKALLDHLDKLESPKIKTSQLCHATLFAHPKALDPVKLYDVCFVHAFEEEFNEERWKITPWHINPEYKFR